MRKYAKLSTLAMFSALTLGALAGCGQKADILLWTGFGSAYTKAVNSLVASHEAKEGIKIKHESQGSYDKLQSNIQNAVSTGNYPNIANGYPDHFANYIKSGIQLSLDSYIKQYKEETGIDLMADYYSQYMVENQSLAYDKAGNAYTMGLPFNKSTEVLGVNGYFVDYAASIDPTLADVPATWAEWAVAGPKYLAAMDTLAGKYLYGVLDEHDHASNFTVAAPADEAPAGKELLLDMEKNVNKDGVRNYRVFSWDATDNMFITIVRQWGSMYTSYTAEDAKTVKHGYAEFASDVKDEGQTKSRKELTMEAMDYFRTAYNANWFGLPKHFSEDSYSSTGFKNNRVMFVVCSSGGLSYNISDAQRLRLSPIPYKDAAHKYVISQGTNLAMFDSIPEDKEYMGFKMIVDFTTGDTQAAWAFNTGYYPASKSATQSATYQKLLTEDYHDNKSKQAYQESAKLNEEHYMDEAKAWTKFVDPGFVGSSSIRTEVDNVMNYVCSDEKTHEETLAYICSRIETFIRK